MLTMLAASAAFSEYDPLKTTSSKNPTTLDIIVHDSNRNRHIPILIYLPESDQPAPVLLFSHGLGGTRKGCIYLGNHWSQRGYLAVFLQHPGSDGNLTKGKSLGERVSALRAAVKGRNGIKNFMWRVKDVPAVLNQLSIWNRQSNHPLNGRLNLSLIGMSGHSYGAITTQAVSGMKTRQGIAAFTDPRIKAALILSPSSPRNADAETLFGDVKIPWMLMTGTKDLAAVGKATIDNRLAVYPALPPGGKYELVLLDGEHHAFTDRKLRRTGRKRNPNHHKVILALSTAFWDAWLPNNTAAKNWLNGKHPNSILEAGDRWQLK
ncbi:MAG: dienelactone hydrolase [bacterium]|nr:dienelactone hydrolase [bacterium]